MPLPSTRHSSLDSFLPQFAPPIDDLTHPGTTPNGDNGLVDVNDRLISRNGHAALSIEDPLGAQPSEDSSLNHQNGAGDHSMFDTILDPSPTHLNGSSPVYAHSAAVIEQPGPVDDTMDSDSMSVSSRQFSLETNGAVGVSIGDSFAPSAPIAEPANDPDESLDSEASRSPLFDTELPPHPAAGSLFTPYLVTEIRQLRNRRSRRGFWRRIFG